MKRSEIVAGILVGLIAVWLIASYFLVPTWWHFHESRHPVLTNGPRVTTTRAGIPGDPLNVAIIGSEDDLLAAMLAAGWHPADPITLRSSLRIATSTILHRPYEDAPVSNLFLFGRKEDFAFEKPVGSDPRERHHVRFWRIPADSAADKPYWVGATTFDRSVGFSHTTGQITHHIASDIDAERDGLLSDLERVQWIGATEWEQDFQTAHEGKNGGGDPWKTDGRLAVLTLRPGGPQETPATPTTP